MYSTVRSKGNKGIQPPDQYPLHPGNSIDSAVSFVGTQQYSYK